MERQGARAAQRHSWQLSTGCRRGHKALRAACSNGQQVMGTGARQLCLHRACGICCRVTALFSTLSHFKLAFKGQSCKERYSNCLGMPQTLTVPRIITTLPPVPCVQNCPLQSIPPALPGLGPAFSCTPPVCLIKDESWVRVGPKEGSTRLRASLGWTEA